MLLVTSTADAASIGVGTQQKIVQNPFELERQAIELERKKEIERQEKIAEEKRIEEERRLAEEKAKQEAERKAKQEAERKAKQEAERKAKQEAERKAAEEAKRKAEEKKKAANSSNQVTATPVSTAPSKKVMTFESTAYTNNAGDNKTYGGRVLTATGHDVTNSIYYKGMRIIAVDPSVIPLGSVVHIHGVGDAIALDTGGRIKGHILDLLVDSKREALNWGRRHIKVTIY